MSGLDAMRAAVAQERGQVATHMRCNSHDLVFPCGEYFAHCQEQHAGHLIAITPVWQDA